MNKEFTLAYYSAAAMEIPSLSLGVAQFTKNGGRIKVHAKTQTQLFDEKQIASFVDHCLQSDMVIIGLHGGRESCPAFDVLADRMEEIRGRGEKLPWIHIQPTGGDEDALGAAQILSTHFGTPVWDRLHQYLNHGGMINFTSLLSYIESTLFGLEDKADAVIHVGKHGSLEWLPGKPLGLSEECYPDLSIMDLPNIYPYIINDPSEGTQAKRRSYCCIIDHLTPVFTNADLYESLADVENKIKEYQDARREDPGKISVLKPMIWEAVVEANLDRDLDITEVQAFGEKGMMRHGYKGAGDISHMMDVALGWDATAEVMEDWMYEQMAQAYVLDEKVKEWMEKVNPYARQNILDKLLEAISRGMWQVEDNMKEQLRQEYLDIEGEIEALTE